MATTQTVNPTVHGYKKRTSKPDDSSMTTTEDIIRELLAQGIPMEKIRIPGKGKNDVLFMSDDFDAPLEEFEDCL